ncbi:hypothetical protein [Legionella jordanis]|uniref:Dot/Icm T4SS effector n=1 Tax=Legionella jordanis TaxID=456 RepID=A0A0W0V813_9GAMM|nr:hypothetical protein [Legionella jordanis]KTD16244.1 hypothetical protein Ljor_0550 [Legionella jordanis]RMX04537.1 hypothetical protein EAW55_03640 [Legionella jordanis]VEH12298.1 Uncharacterised protein [Legionella jordanis]
MPFTVATLEELIEFGKYLAINYKTERAQMDRNRFLGLFRSDTDNPVRKSDINFLINITNHIETHQLDYNVWAKAFKAPIVVTPKLINEFLRRALAGAFLFGFKAVDSEYLFEDSVKDRSALGKLFCELFDIEKMSDIPVDDLKKCLNDLRVYVNFTNNNSGTPLKWHKHKSNKVLLEEISAAISYTNSLKSTLAPTLS